MGKIVEDKVHVYRIVYQGKDGVNELLSMEWLGRDAMGKDSWYVVYDNSNNSTCFQIALTAILQLTKEPGGGEP
jgi:hypothetical protein